MQKTTDFPRKRIFLALMLSVAGVVGIGSVTQARSSVWKWWSKPAPSRPAVPPAPAPPSPAQSTKGSKVVIASVWHYGFETTSMVFSAGDTSIFFRNRSGSTNLNFQVLRLTERESETVGSVFAVRGANVQFRRTLEPGSYRLVETGHPDWICNVTVTP